MKKRRGLFRKIVARSQPDGEESVLEKKKPKRKERRVLTLI